RPRSPTTPLGTRCPDGPRAGRAAQPPRLRMAGEGLRRVHPRGGARAAGLLRRTPAHRLRRAAPRHRRLAVRDDQRAAQPGPQHRRARRRARMRPDHAQVPDRALPVHGDRRAGRAGGAGARGRRAGRGRPPDDPAGGERRPRAHPAAPRRPARPGDRAGRAVTPPHGAGPAGTNPWVRPYVLTGGRTRTRQRLHVHTLVSVPHYDPGYADLLPPEARPLYDRAPPAVQSIAELSAHCSVSLGVTRVLLGDMAARDRLVVNPEAYTSPYDPRLLERVIDGLHQLAR